MLLRTAAVLVLAAALAGCGGGPEGPQLYPVTGEVTFDGQPVNEGRILMRMAGGDQRAYSADIKDGKYAIDAEAGSARVEITASRLIPGKFSNVNGTPEPMGEMYIPVKYNSASILTAEIKPEGENKVPFALEGNKK